MGTTATENTMSMGRTLFSTLQGLLMLVLLTGVSGCWFSGGPAEDEIDPKEATAREATYRSDAEKEQAARFGDRMQRRTDLSQPVRAAGGERPR